MIYDQVVKATGIDPTKGPKEVTPTKRQIHAAGRLTGKVWDAINSDKPSMVDGIEVSI